MNKLLIIGCLSVTSTAFGYDTAIVGDEPIKVNPLIVNWDGKVPDIKGFTLGMTMEQCLIKKMGEDEYRRELSMVRESRGADFYWGISKGNPNVCHLFLGTPIGSKQKKITIAGAEANIVGQFKVETPKSESILYVVHATFSSSVSDTVLEGLIEKYGNPTSKKLTEKSNRMGAKFSGVEAMWKIGPSYTILFQSIGSKVDESSLSIFDDNIMNQISTMKNPLSKDI
jgi:hypothetical protein